MLWKKTFEKKMDPNKVELFSSFFSAIRSFVKEIISDSSSKEGLKNLEMGNFAVNITHVEKLNVDVVAITDKGDQSNLSKFIPKLLGLLYEHSELFEDWDGNKSRFDVLDFEIMVLVTNEGDDLFDTKSSKKIGQQISGLEKEQREKYKKEINFLKKKLTATSNLYKKIEVIDGICNIAIKLADSDKINWCKRQKKSFEQQIDSTKYKINYFITKTKDAINKTVQNVGGQGISDLNFRDAYISLYSFSSKLKSLGKEDLSGKYRDWAKELIDKNDPQKISNLISEILKLPDSADFYLSN